MSDPSTRLEELIQADLDGRLSGAERAELAGLLLQDPAARRLQDALRRTDRLLRDLPQAEPPGSLRPAIHRALGLTDGLARPAGRPARNRIYRYAAAILGSAVALGLGYSLLQDHPGSRNDLQGSVMKGLSGGPAAAEARLQAGEGAVLAALTATPTGLRLDLRSTGRVPVEVIAHYDPAVLTPADEGHAAVAAEPGRLSIALDAPGQVGAIGFTGHAPIRLEISVAGQQPVSALLTPDRVP